MSSDKKKTEHRDEYLTHASDTPLFCTLLGLYTKRSTIKNSDALKI